MIRPLAPARALGDFLALQDPAGDFSVAVAGTSVALTHVDRVYWPEDRITKHEVLRYYALVWPELGPFLFERPMILKRFPRGLSGPSFFQHDFQGAPSGLARARLRNRQGRTIHYAVVRTLADLFTLVNAGALELHPWLSRLDALDRPSLAVIDLDPGEGVVWRQIEELALVVRDVLARDFGVQGAPKTSGSRGLHVLVALDGRRRYDELGPALRELGRQVAGRAGTLATLERSLSKRGPRQIYVDLLQNARGKGIVAPYSLRVRPHAPLSWPLSWDEVERGVDPALFTLRRAGARAPLLSEPWRDFSLRPQRLGAAPSRAPRG